ncbi:MAG: glycoside hydrolase domain-containing protein [Planctomycetota bacterium]
MRILWTIALFCVVSPVGAQQAAFFDELTPLYPDVSARGASEWHSDTARGVPVGVHVVVRDLPPGSVLSWQLDNVPTARAYKLLPVPVEQNTGLTGRTEAFKSIENPHVIRDAPFSVYEVLEPCVGRTIVAAETGIVVLRVEVDVPVTAAASVARHVLQLRCGEWSQSLPWNWTIYPVTIPPPTSRSRGFTNWFSIDQIAQRHALEKWSEPFFAMVGKYADLMHRSRQDTFWIRWPHFIRFRKGKFVVEKERFARYVRLFLDRGFTRIEGGHLARRHKNDWDSSRLDLAFTRVDITSELGKARLAMLLDSIQTLLAEVPAGFEYLQHLSDEPTDTNAASYRALAASVRKQLPHVQVFEATMSRSVVGAVQHWCPLVKEFQEHRDFFEERRRAGESVWVYTCVLPGGRWLNRLLDQERLRPVYIGWALSKYDLAGYLHWGLNLYRQDPFKHSIAPHEKGPPYFLPPGDSHVVYPGANGPYSGQRLEAQRIGMEDGHLLDRLLTDDPRAARCVIDSVVRSFDDYDTNVAAYRRAKRSLLQAVTGQAPRYLRVLSYNIHHGRGTDGNFDYDRLASVIRRTNPDLVALQEVDRNTRRVDGVDQAALLGQKLRMHAAFGEAMPYSGGSYGEAILSRFPLLSNETHKLGCAAGQEPRAALSVTVAPWGKSGPTVQFTGTHLCHQSQQTRTQQVQEVVAAIAGWSGPAILAGDFNFAPDSAPYEVLATSESAWSDVARRLGREQPTFGANLVKVQRSQRIDMVWNRRGRGLIARAIEVVEEPLASDHLPVLVVFELAGTGQ